MTSGTPVEHGETQWNHEREIAPAFVGVGPDRQQATPEKLHVIRLKKVSTNAENVAIPTTHIQHLKQSQGNYVRNCSVSAAAPVGGGRAWPDFEIDHSVPSGSRVAIARAGRRPRAHQAARPTGTRHQARAPGTRHQARATKHAPRNTPHPTHSMDTQSGPEPIGSGPPSMLSDYRRCAPGEHQRATAVSCQ